MATGNNGTDANAGGASVGPDNAASASPAPGPAEQLGPGWNVFDPASVAPGGPAASGEPAKRGRGRPRKSASAPGGSGTAATAPAYNPVNVEKLVKTLEFVHGCLALITKTPECKIDEAEARMLAAPLADLQNLYRVDVSEKAMAWGHMLGVASVVYGPRVAAVQMRRARARGAARPQANGAAPAAPGAAEPIPADVVTFTGPVDLTKQG